MLNVIDVASWQAGLDLEALYTRNPALDGVIVKTTGYGYVNPYADPWIQWLRAHGKPWGFYHYLSEYGRKLTARQEAEFFVRNCENYFGEGTPWLDYEDPTAKALGPGWLYDVAREIFDLTGVRPGVYFSYGLLLWQDFSALAAEGYPFWCARYANSRPTGFQSDPWQPDPVTPFSRMTMLQYSSTGRLPGWDKNLDLNLFYGSYAEWLELARGGASAPEPPAELQGPDPQVVADVLADKYGTLADRVKALTKAGYDPAAVQATVDRLYGVADKVRPLVAAELPYLDSICKILRG